MYWFGERGRARGKWNIQLLLVFTTQTHRWKGEFMGCNPDWNSRLCWLWGVGWRVGGFSQGPRGCRNQMGWNGTGGKLDWECFSRCAESEDAFCWVFYLHVGKCMRTHIRVQVSVCMCIVTYIYVKVLNEYCDYFLQFSVLSHQRWMWH